MWTYRTVKQKLQWIGCNLLFLTLSGIILPAIVTELAIAKEAKEGVSISSQSQNLLSQGKVAYQAGRYAEAKTIWQQAYQEQKIPLNRALSLNYLALTSHKLGELSQAQTYIDRSLQLIEREPVADNKAKIKAQILNTQGRLHLTQGNGELALKCWQEATQIYRQVGDEVGVLGSWINQGQAWQTMGLYRRSQKLLQEIAVELDQQSDATLKIAGFRSLGIALQVTGDLEYAQQMLQNSLEISQQLNLPEESSATLFSLGNTALALKESDRAIAYYREVVANTAQPLLKTEALLNQLGIYVATKQWQKVATLLPEARIQVTKMAHIANRRGIYARVNLAKHLIAISKVKPADRQTLTETKQLLTASIQQARLLKDKKSESYGLGILGNFYESQGEWSLGNNYTQKAVQLADLARDSDLIYQWQWQLGRLLEHQNDRQGAIAAYSESVTALESLRGDLMVTNADAQFSFRESVEPVYRELAGLLLEQKNGKAVSQSNLLRARNTIESLQLAELNNFFREACLDAKPTSIDEIDPQAAVIYPIILSDRLEIIVSLPDKSLHHYSQPISQTELEPVIESLRQTIQIRSRRSFYEPSRQLYNWLIRPTLADLTAHNIKTIVFIPDGSLRNIPISALHDGEQYLIENFNIALTPGLQLLSPLPLEKVKLSTLAAGITQQRRGFSSLEYVNDELESIDNYMDSVVLRDENFTQNSLKEKIEQAQYPIVHIATHGQFSSDLKDTFLLAWDDNIDIDRLDDLLSNTDPNKQRSIELLILSACETASGDDRAALGLAGIAVRAGARTTLATLWSVSDRSTALTMNHFYERIAQPNLTVNKAHALRQSQMALINSRQFDHPYYWAPFVMVGNWL